MNLRKRTPALSHLILLFLTVSISEAQLVGTITSAKNGKPLPGVEVFVNRTSLATETDESGLFQLEGIPGGFVELVLYKKGFVLYQSTMRIQEARSYDLKLTLEPEKVKSGKGSPEEMARLRKELLGDGAMADQLVIRNEKQLAVKAENDGYQLLSQGPIEINHPYLGYRIHCYLPQNSFRRLSEAPVKYKSLEDTDVKQEIEYEKRRLASFRGSLRHWLMAMATGKTAEEGFSIENQQGAPIDAKDLVTAATLPLYYRIKLDSPVVVKFGAGNNEAATTRISSSGLVEVNRSGVMINPRLVKADGAMGQPGLAYQIPLDFKPIAGDIEATYAEALNRFFEKVYVHTDKPYYYPGEPLWFKGYVNYYFPLWRDSLSKVLHVELISPERKILLERAVKVEGGSGHGDFILPDSLKSGNYYLRVYTDLRRNYGDENHFIKPLPILKMTDKMDATQGHRESSGINMLSISANKQEYRTREKITLALDMKDREGKPLTSSLSVSVTDAAQVISLPEARSIEKGYPISEKEIGKITNLNYRAEQGVSFYGQFVNDRGKPEKTRLNFIQWKTDDVLVADTDEKGSFWQTGLQFTDTASFSYKSEKAKDRPYGKVKLLPREFPAMNFKEIDYPVQVIEAGTIQRIVSEYEVPKDTRLLAEVEVKSTRLGPPGAAARTSYGRADRVLLAKDLNMAYSNLLYSLVGKVPGLIVNPTMGTIYFSRASGTSFTLGTGPMVEINGIPVDGDAGTILQTIDPSTVESIGLTKRINVLYGTGGRNGVISIYTKTGITDDPGRDPNFQTIKIPGYSAARKFRSPDYSDPLNDSSPTDFRATLYWNPSVTTDAQSGTTTVSFFAADLPGQYRVVVEGVTQSGEPVRAVYYIKVESR